jgi:hypothetical protein
LVALAEFTAHEIKERATSPLAEEHNLIVLGDFNIDRRGDNPLFQAFISEAQRSRSVVGIKDDL